MTPTTDIIELFADIVRRASENCELYATMPDGNVVAVACPPLNYVFGDNRYIRERLEELSRSANGNERKLPMVALFCPFEEQRGAAGGVSVAKVHLLIACSSMQQYSNEQRLARSFQGVLRPIYRRLMQEIESDGRVNVNYDGSIPHRYSENYSYGRFGAYDNDGKKLGEVIDAINLYNLEIKVKPQTCRQNEQKNLLQRAALYRRKQMPL